MNSASSTSPLPSRSVPWPPPFPYSSPASRLALKPSGFTTGTTIVRVFGHEVANAGVTAAVAENQLVGPLHRVLARGPLARVVHAELEEDGAAVAGVRVRRDLDALDRTALVGLVVQRDRARRGPGARAPDASCPRCSRTGAGSWSGRSGTRSWRWRRRTARPRRGPARAWTAMSGTSTRVGEVVVHELLRVGGAVEHRLDEARGRRARSGRARGRLSSFLRARSASTRARADTLPRVARVDRDRLEAQLCARRAARQAAGLDDQIAALDREARGHLARRRCRRSRPRRGRSPGRSPPGPSRRIAAVRRAVTAPAERHRHALLGHPGPAALSAGARLVDRARGGNRLREQSSRRRRRRQQQRSKRNYEPDPPA